MGGEGEPTPVAGAIKVEPGTAAVIPSAEAANGASGGDGAVAVKTEPNENLESLAGNTTQTAEPAAPEAEAVAQVTTSQATEPTPQAIPEVAAKAPEAAATAKVDTQDPAAGASDATLIVKKETNEAKAAGAEAKDAPEAKLAVDADAAKQSATGSKEATAVATSLQAKAERPKPLMLPTQGVAKSRGLVRAEEAIEREPYDAEAWTAGIVAEAQRLPIDSARELYERFLARFPSGGRYWKLYIEHELKSRNVSRAEALFKRCLPIDDGASTAGGAAPPAAVGSDAGEAGAAASADNAAGGQSLATYMCPHVDLWLAYLKFLRDSDKSREEREKAYEQAVADIGLDPLCTPIWQQYISFLKAADAPNMFAQQERMGKVRRAYRRAIEVPKQGVEQLWRDYTVFEQGIDKLIAKKVMDDFSGSYSKSRRVSRELENLSRGINHNRLSLPPTANQVYRREMELWANLVDYEKSDPLSSLDPNSVVSRVAFLFRRYLACFGHFPGVWHEAAMFCASAASAAQARGDDKSYALWAAETKNTFRRALKVLPESFLLSFAFADYLEGLAEDGVSQAKQVYIDLIARPAIDPTLAYVQYIRHARRTKGISGAREVFKHARADLRIGHEVFVASALQELLSGAGDKGRKVCLNIFKLGMKSFSDHPGFIGAYLDFLFHMGDNNNTRAVFEQVLPTLPAEQAASLWARFVAFEGAYGNLDRIKQVERRRTEAGQQRRAAGGTDGPPLLQLLDRYTFGNLLPADPSVLLSIGCAEGMAGAAPLSFGGDSEASAGLPRGIHATPQTPGGGRFSQFPRPNLKQMVVMRPSRMDHVMLLVRPPSVVKLMQHIPPPETYTGPHVNVDRILKIIAAMELPDPPEEEHPDVAAAGASAPAPVAPSGRRKRGRGNEDLDEVPKAPAQVAASTDIFRSRQRQKAKLGD